MVAYYLCHTKIIKVVLSCNTCSTSVGGPMIIKRIVQIAGQRLTTNFFCRGRS